MKKINIITGLAIGMISSLLVVSADASASKYLTVSPGGYSTRVSCKGTYYIPSGNTRWNVQWGVVSTASGTSRTYYSYISDPDTVTYSNGKSVVNGSSTLEVVTNAYTSYSTDLKSKFTYNSSKNTVSGLLWEK